MATSRTPTISHIVQRLSELLVSEVLVLLSTAPCTQVLTSGSGARAYACMTTAYNIRPVGPYRPTKQMAALLTPYPTCGLLT